MVLWYIWLAILSMGWAICMEIRKVFKQMEKMQNSQTIWEMRTYLKSVNQSLEEMSKLLTEMRDKMK